MNLMYLLWGIITLAVVILVSYLIPVLLQMKRTLNSLDGLITSVDSQLKPLLSEINETTSHLNSIISQVEGGVTRVSNVSQSLGRLTEGINTLVSIFKESVNPQVVLLSSLLLGLKEGIATLKEKWR